MPIDPFAGVLDPFAYWNIATSYDRYSAFFDLVIYSTIFIALCHVIFTNRFSGRAGKAMASAFGIGLGIALTLTETQFGWNLRQAGPYALILILLLLGYLLLHVLMTVHMPWKLALPLTYILMYALLRALSPGLFTLLAQRIPFINLLTALVFLLAVWQLGIALWESIDRPSRDNGTPSGCIAKLNRPTEKRTLKIEKQIKGKLAPEVTRNTKKLEHKLEAIQREVKKSAPKWDLISQALQSITRRSEEIIQRVDQIKTLDRRLQNFDWQELKELNSYYRDLSSEDQARLKELIQSQRNKLVQEQALSNLTDRIERRHQTFRRALDQLSRSCQIHNQDQATHQCDSAIGIEKQQLADTKTLRQLQTQLYALTKQKLKA